MDIQMDKLTWSHRLKGDAVTERSYVVPPQFGRHLSTTSLSVSAVRNACKTVTCIYLSRQLPEFHMIQYLTSLYILFRIFKFQITIFLIYTSFSKDQLQLKIANMFFLFECLFYIWPSACADNQGQTCQWVH